MSRALLSLTLALAAAGCGRLLGGGCDDGWIPRPGACDAGARADRAAGGDATDASMTDATDASMTDATDASTNDNGPDAPPAVDGAATDGGDGGGGDSATLDGGDGGIGDGGVPSDGPRPCTPPERTCGDHCVNLAADPLHCGACDAPCGVGRFCVGGTCAALCAPPRILCVGACVDPESDPDNCGGCGVVCPTGLCNGGRCRDERAGHLVLIGHDLRSTRADQQRLVGNAVFLTAASAPRLALFTAWASAQSVDNVEAAVRAVAGPRAVRITRIATGEALEGALSIDANDVVLIAHQPDASDAQVGELARRVSARVAGFARAGGVVVVLDGEGRSAGTWPFAERTALLPVSGHSVATGRATELVNGADGLAIGLSSAWRAEESSVTFSGSDGRGVVVRVDGRPLAIHQVVFR